MDEDGRRGGGWLREPLMGERERELGRRFERRFRELGGEPMKQYVEGRRPPRRDERGRFAPQGDHA